eukprot:11227144-Lingulodinium_polyedra.AAC.1
MLRGREAATARPLRDCARAFVHGTVADPHAWIGDVFVHEHILGQETEWCCGLFVGDGLAREA